MHDYKNLTLPELKSMSKKLGLSGYSSMKKDELVKMMNRMESSSRSRSRSSSRSSSRSPSKKCKRGVRQDGMCKKKPGRKSRSRSRSPARSTSKSPSKRGPGRPRKSKSPSKTCKYGLRQDGMCKKKPGRKSMSRSRSPARSTSKSPSKRGPGRPRKSMSPVKKTCKYGLRQDGMCKKKPGRKSLSRSRSPARSTSKSPSKRGPGRPRKSQSPKKSASKQCKYGLRQDGMCKKKPGRKSASPARSASKRGPGRPRKSKSPMKAVSKSPSKSASKRGPGRPRKSTSQSLSSKYSKGFIGRMALPLA